MDSVAPFVHSGRTVNKTMAHVAVALVPVLGGAMWYFQGRGILVVALALCSSLLAGCCLAPHKLTWDNVVTGLLLALLLPPVTPPWAVVMGGFLAVLGVKALFGGLGKNWINPACGAALLVLLLVPQTPLRLVTGTLVVGYTKGSLGEVSSLLLLIGGIYLALHRLLAWRVFLAYFIFTCLTSASLPGCNPLAVLAWGGTWLCGLFLLSDPVTSPMSKGPRTLYGAGCGILTTYFSYYISAVGGLCLGVVLMNVIGRGVERLSNR